jgi:hypothetical protein
MLNLSAPHVTGQRRKCRKDTFDRLYVQYLILFLKGRNNASCVQKGMLCLYGR